MAIYGYVHRRAEPSALSVIGFDPAAYMVPPGATQVTLTVTRTGDTSPACSVDYATINGTAVAGVDFTSAAGQLLWEAGDADPKSIVVGLVLPEGLQWDSEHVTPSEYLDDTKTVIYGNVSEYSQLFDARTVNLAQADDGVSTLYGEFSTTDNVFMGGVVSGVTFGCMATADEEANPLFYLRLSYGTLRAYSAAFDQEFDLLTENVQFGTVGFLVDWASRTLKLNINGAWIDFAGQSTVNSPEGATALAISATDTFYFFAYLGAAT